MARILKNYTNEEISIICNQKEIVIPANDSYDLTETFTLSQLMDSDSLLAIIAQGIDKYQLNDGNNDLTVSQALELVKGWKECILKSDDGKQLVRAESRPLNCTTYFTTRGDTIGETPSIGTGAKLSWDASISDEWTTDNCPEGFKKKDIIIQFVDSIWIKDGTLYYKNVLKDSYIDMFVICPNGGYYLYLDELCQNTTGNDLIIDHYLNQMPIQGDVPMGDELNTEVCSQELPNYLKFMFRVTVPISDTTSYGYGLFEVYRQRTVII